MLLHRETVRINDIPTYARTINFKKWKIYSDKKIIERYIN